MGVLLRVLLHAEKADIPSSAMQDFGSDTTRMLRT